MSDEVKSVKRSLEGWLQDEGVESADRIVDRIEHLIEAKIEEYNSGGER